MIHYQLYFKVSEQQTTYSWPVMSSEQTKKLITMSSPYLQMQWAPTVIVRDLIANLSLYLNSISVHMNHSL